MIFFIDRALAGYDAVLADSYRKGLADTEQKRAELFPGSATIAGLTPIERVALLQAIEKTDFFRLVRRHTILGYFGHPKHGGNRNSAASKLLGIEASIHFHPPFGYYDRDGSK